MEKTAIKPSKLSRNTRAIMAIVGSCLTLMVTGGCIYGVSTMSVVPMAEKFGVEVSQTQLYYTFWAISLCVAGFFGAPILAKFNLNGSAIIGGVTGGLGLLLMAIGPNLYIYWAGAFLTGLPIVFAGPALLQTTISKWFYKGRALLIGVIGLCEAVGTTIISVVIAKSIENGSIVTAMCTAAAIIFVGNLIVSFLIKGCPEDYGWVPVGAEKFYAELEAKAAISNTVAEVPGLTRKQAFMKPEFWGFMATCIILNVGYGIVQPQAVTYTQFVGYTAAQAAIVGSCYSWGKGIWKVVYGLLADRFSIRWPFCGVMAVAVIMGVFYVDQTNLTMICINAFCFGCVGALSGGGTLGVSRMCGQKDLKRLALLPHGFNAFGNLFGPIIFSACYTGDATGYRIVAIMSVCILALYIVINVWALRPAALFENKRAL